MEIQVSLDTAALDYELFDTGGFEKLERFGKFILRRPEPQALWSKSLDQEWNEAHAHYQRLKADHYRDPEEAGKWNTTIKGRWPIGLEINGKRLEFLLALTAFKHVGIFPEQVGNWQWISDFVAARQGARVLNLFAYTGAASVVARAAGAEVWHLDAVKTMVSWARENMEHNGLDGIRWIVDDAVKFVKRDLRRGARYDLIIMDPPAYGRGPNGEKWVMETHLNEHVHDALQLLAPKGVLLLNLYSLSHSALLMRNWGVACQRWGEAALADRGKRLLPLGIFGCLAPH